MGLLNVENCARFYLCEAATVDDAVDLQSEMGLELLAFGIGETNIGKRQAGKAWLACIYQSRRTGPFRTIVDVHDHGSIFY